ncbi:MAG TPA: PQQ-binding-like beta-propeller repeat protein [Chloroflexia bacterium]|nr:PQQ-binding-like beta-propeller repeat protein [Chloroflexia bacterium]
MNRRLKSFALLGLFLGLALLAGPARSAVPAASDNPDQSVTYGINARHDGYVADSSLAPPLKRLWAVDLSGSVSYPLVVNSLVYVVVGHPESDAYGYGGWLEALDARTGALVWGPIEQGGVYWPGVLAYDSGRVFAANKDGILRAYDAETGTPLWTLSAGGDRVFDDSPLVAHNGVVYTSSGRSLRAIDATSGATLWSSDRGGTSAPAVDDAAVYTGGCGPLTALAPRTGAILWQNDGVPCSFGSGASVVLHNQRLYVAGDQKNLYVFDAATGNQLQIYTSSYPPAFVGNRGFLMDSGTLQGFDATTGKIQWSFAGDGNLLGPPIVVRDTLYVRSSGDGPQAGPATLYAVDAASGAQQFAIPVAPPDAQGGFDVSHGVDAIAPGAGSDEFLVPDGDWLIAFSSANGSLPPLATPRPPAPLPAGPAGGGPDQTVALQGDATHSGNLSADPLRPPLQQLWSLDVTDTLSAPLVVGNLVFVLAGDKLEARDLHTGALSWGPVPQGGNGHLAYDAGQVFAVSTSGVLRAYQAQTGVPTWSAKLPTDSPYDLTLTAYKGVVYVGGSESPLFAVDAQTGARRWTGQGRSGNPAVNDTAVYLASGCGAIALDPQAGTPLWDSSGSCSSESSGAPVLYGGRLYIVGGGNNLYVFDAANGQQQQIYAAQSEPAFAGPRGFVVVGNQLQAFAVASGAIQWTFTGATRGGSPGYPGPERLGGPPLVVGNMVYLGASSGTLYGVDPVSGRQVVALTGLGGAIDAGLGAGNGILVVPAGSHLSAFTSSTGSLNPPGGAAPRYFPETGHTLQGRFREYWDTHGGLAQQGYPLSDELSEKNALDGKTYTVQYFERAVFELHPENRPPYDVLLSQLGTLRYRAKYPQGAPGQQRNPNHPLYFAATGHVVGGSFRRFWEAHGGLAQLGYPLTEEFSEQSELNGKTYTVQYFERMVLEWHPENRAPFDVLGSQLGRFAYQARHPQP